MSLDDELQQRSTGSLRVGIIGDPVAHSFSPRFQQAAFDALHIAARYELWHTPADKLVERVRSLYEEDYLGANVTIPHKLAVLPLLDKIDPLAARIGAVNTIVHCDDSLYGYNTDAPGLIHALYEHGLGEPRVDGQAFGQGQAPSLRGYTAVLLGAGGAARGAAFGLVEAGIERLIIVNRNLERAQSLATEVQRVYNGPIASFSDPTLLNPYSASIIINATPLGMYGDVSPLSTEQLARFAPDTFVYDMIYNPGQTYLLRLAQAMGLRTANGLSMLLHQGALAFKLWTKQDAPFAVMRAALF
jgi:shikimate dehydrogenase